MTEFQRHCGSIKRRGIERIAAASEQLRADLEVSCSGLIMGTCVCVCESACVCDIVECVLCSVSGGHPQSISQLVYMNASPLLAV